MWNLSVGKELTAQSAWEALRISNPLFLDTKGSGLNITPKDGLSFSGSPLWGGWPPNIGLVLGYAARSQV